MKDKPLIIYWSSAVPPSHGNWSLLYPKIETLYDNLISKKVHGKDDKNYLVCPAATADFKKIIMAKFPHDARYEYKYSNGILEMNPTSKQYINFNLKRNATITTGPTVEFSMAYSFFCEEDVMASFMPPMFHPPKYTKYASVVPGSFNIGSWYRPYPLEMQFWNNEGEILFEENEPLFYVKIETDRPIILKRYVFTKELESLQIHCIKYYNKEYGQKGLIKRYNQFKLTGMRDLVMHEIKKNLVE
jgi:hypothetical protein